MSTDEFMQRFVDPDRVVDPMRSAQRSQRQDLPMRFYTEVTLQPAGEAFAIALDGRQAKTPARHVLATGPLPLAEAMAQEWRAQETVIDPATMPLTRLINVALDRVPLVMAETRAEMAGYAGSDLLCYRAAFPERLVEQQALHWDPVLEWAATLGARFNLAQGVIHMEQPQESLALVAQRLDAVDNPLALTALSMVTAMTGSVLLGLALAAGAIDANAAWAAAHVDEDVQIAIWGNDDEALVRRANRRRDFDAAALVLEHANPR
jgi:chaperone required for assembly of F1-ATPase